MLLSLESLTLSPLSSFPVTRTSPVSCKWSGTHVGRPGSEDAGQTGMGSPRRLGRYLPSPRKRARAGTPGDQPQARRCHTHRRRERNMRVPVVPPSGRQRSAAGWPAGSRSALIVPWKPGNSTREEPGGREARHRVTTPMARNAWEALNSRAVLPKRHRIAIDGFAAASCRW